MIVIIHCNTSNDSNDNPRGGSVCSGYHLIDALMRVRAKYNSSELLRVSQKLSLATGYKAFSLKGKAPRWNCVARIRI